jgi:hypothetical protein
MILAPEKNDNLLATLSEFAYAEYGSAIEMLAAAKNTESAKLKIGYIFHALDEYRHTFLILKVLKNQIDAGVGKFNKNYQFNPGAVIKKGYVDKEGFLIEKLNLQKFVEFVYSNEYLAKEAFDGLKKRISDKNSMKIIQNITLDEQNHSDDSIETLNDIMKDELGHHGHAKSFYLKHFSETKLKIAFRREKVKNKFRLFYLKNVKFLGKVIDPIIHLIIYCFGKIVNLINVPKSNRDNLMEMNEKSII